MKRKSRKKWIVLGAVVLLAALAAIWVMNTRQGTQGNYIEETVKTQDLSTYLSFSGHVRASEDKQIVAKRSMKVKELYVSEGDVIERGTLILRATDGERVYADIAGTIEKLYPEADSPLSPGSAIANIVNYGELMVKVDADEYDVGALSVGQDVSIYVNALGTTASGAISKIANDATVGKDVSYYTVEIALHGAGGLRAGMSVEARVLDKTAEGATTVSMRALQFDAENQPFLYMRDANGRMAMQYVSVGISDGTTVQILAGVYPGESVYRPPRRNMMMPGMGMMGNRR